MTLLKSGAPKVQLDAAYHVVSLIEVTGTTVHELRHPRGRHRIRELLTSYRGSDSSIPASKSMVSVEYHMGNSQAKQRPGTEEQGFNR